jgi:hypothetical protein
MAIAARDKPFLISGKTVPWYGTAEALDHGRQIAENHQ